jgi:hypothetical protein
VRSQPEVDREHDSETQNQVEAMTPRRQPKPVPPLTAKRHFKIEHRNGDEATPEVFPNIAAFIPVRVMAKEIVYHGTQLLASGQKLDWCEHRRGKGLILPISK